MPAEGAAPPRARRRAGAAAPCSLSVGTRPDVHGTAWAAHAHWLLGHDDEALAACREAIALARAIGAPVQPGGGAGLRRHHPPDAPATCPGCGTTVGELRELCERYGFAYYREWGLILDGWSRADEPGIDLARQGIDNLKAEGAFARMPYWLSLLADLLARDGQPDAARATLDAALAAGAGPRRPVVAARGDADARRLRRRARPRVARLRAAAAAGVGARQRRAAAALRARPRARAAFRGAASRRSPDGLSASARAANAARTPPVPSFGLHCSHDGTRRGHTMTTTSRP